jgi:hypothetical protein
MEKGHVKLEFCSTHDQVADVLTKSLSKEKFCYFRELLGVKKFGSREILSSDTNMLHGLHGNLFKCHYACIYFFE